MAQLSDQPGLREVADVATAKLQAAIDSLQSRCATLAGDNPVQRRVELAVAPTHAP